MSLMSSHINIKKNNIIRLKNSNKILLIRHNLIKKEDDSIVQNEIPEKAIIKVNNCKTSISVKKVRQLKKISINDNENKSTILKKLKTNKTNKSLFSKKNTVMTEKKKLDNENNENQKMNLKEKITHNRIQRKPLNLDSNDDKIKIGKNSNINDIKMKFLKISKSNKLNKLLNDIDINLNEEKNNKNITFINNNNSNQKDEIKEKNSNKTFIDLSTQKTIIENGKTKEDDEELEANKCINTSHDDDLEYIFKYDRKKSPEKKSHFNTSIIPKKTKKKFIDLKKNDEKNNMKKKFAKKRINIIHKKMNSDNFFLNESDKKGYNSINGKSYINLINNFDIINIISNKEKNKKVTNSIYNNPNFNNSKELSEENFIKQCPTLEKKFQLNGLNIIYKDINESLEERPQKEDYSYINKTSRNIKPMHKSIFNLNSKNSNNINNRNQTITLNYFNDAKALQNNRKKNYFIPNEIASLTKIEEPRKERINFNKKKSNNSNDNKNKIINNTLLNSFGKNRKNHINFGANNQKKKAILFNFNDKIKKIDNIRYLTFHSKRANSFINKRNMHISERNNSFANFIINDSEKDNSNRDADLVIQEKKLNLLSSEIQKYKFRKKLYNISNACSFSFNKITGNNLYKNKNEEEIIIKRNKNYILQRNKQNKKYKTFHLKINPLNINKNKNDIFSYGDKLVIKRGDLLNRLRKIKHDYINVELSSIN